jgi:hypothetical protein
MAKLVLITVLLAGEAGLDECEAGLHEDHQHCADDHPQQAGLLAEHDHRVFTFRECGGADEQGGGDGSDGRAE